MHPSFLNISSLKTAIEWGLNIMSEEFILKVFKSFWTHVDSLIEKKNGGHIDQIYYFVSISIFCC